MQCHNGTDTQNKTKSSKIQRFSEQNLMYAHAIKVSQVVV